jgi:hypothetical protein
MNETEVNEIAVKKLNNIYIGLIVFVLVDIVLIIVGERPKDQGFFEYAAWTTVGLGNLIIIVIAFLVVLGWAVG